MRTILALLLVGTLTVAGVAARADSPEELLAAASALYDKQDYAGAATKLDAFLAANPNHAKAGTAALVLGQARSQLKQYALAVPAYEKAATSRESSIANLAELGLGEAAINTGKFDKAATALQAAVKTSLKPEQAAVAWYWLAQADFQLKKYDLAADAYNKVTRDYGRSDFVDDAYFGAGLSALRQKKQDEARDRLKVVIDRYPNSEDRPKALLLVGQMDLEAKRYPDARRAFEQLLQNGGNKAVTKTMSASAEDGLIQALLAMQDYGAATARLESAMNRLPATDPEHFRAALSLGNCRYRQQQYDNAFHAYEEAAKAPEPSVAGQGLYWAANTQLQSKHAPEAAALFLKFVAKFPKSELAAKAQMKAGDALYDANQHSAALAAYHAVVTNYPQTPEATEAKKMLGGIVDSISDPGQLAAAIKNAPPAERARGEVRLARLYLAAKKYPEAALAVADALKLMPEPAIAGEAQYVQGLANEAQHKIAPAAASYAAALRSQPNALWSSDAAGRLAWLYLDLKQPANAEKAATTALGLKPTPEAEQQARLALVQAELDQQKWDAALDGCKTLLANNPSQETMGTVLFTQAWINDKQGRPQDALPLWERLANDFPKSAYADEALLHVGDARLKAEKYEEARDKYTALVTNYPKSSLAPEARFKLGTSEYNLKRFPEAAVAFDAVAADKSAGDYGPEALYWSGVALAEAKHNPEAIERLSKLVTTYPSHTRVKNAKIRLAALKATVGN